MSIGKLRAHRDKDSPIDFAWLEEAFGREHEKTYGHRAGAEARVDTLRFSARDALQKD